MSSINTFAQANINEKLSIKQLFWGSRLVDQQTTSVVAKHSLNFEILHRFGTIANGFDDIFGMYASSNISMGLQYAIFNKMEIHFFSEKQNKTQEFGFKYQILRQSINNKIPISLTFYSNIAIDARNKSKFGINYKFTDRLFYTNQLIVSKQINYKFNIHLSVAYVHFNAVEKLYIHNKLDINTAIACMVFKNKSLFISYQQPLGLKPINNTQNKPKSGLAFGFETSSHTHNFQVFMTTRDNIILAKDVLNNNNSISFNNFRLGFNIQVKISNYK